MAASSGQCKQGYRVRVARCGPDRHLLHLLLFQKSQVSLTCDSLEEHMVSCGAERLSATATPAFGVTKPNKTTIKTTPCKSSYRHLRTSLINEENHQSGFGWSRRRRREPKLLPPALISHFAKQEKVLSRKWLASALGFSTWTVAACIVPLRCTACNVPRRA